MATVASTHGLAADDCRNAGAVITGLDTAFLGRQHFATVGRVQVAYRRFGPLELSVPSQRPMVWLSTPHHRRDSSTAACLCTMWLLQVCAHYSS
jgi:hypothetical protein